MISMQDIEKEFGRGQIDSIPPENILEMYRLDPRFMERLVDSSYASFNTRLRAARIDMSNPEFINKFGEEVVARDLKFVREKKGKYAQDRFNPEAKGRGPLPEIAESMAATDLYELGFFGKPGKEIFVTPASDYDDLKHKTDFILELAPKEEREGNKSSFIAAIDITTIDPGAQEGNDNLGKKFYAIQELIEKEKLGGFKYYKSPRDGRIVSYENGGVPHIIIIMPPEMVRDLLLLLQLKEERPDDKSLVEYCWDKLEKHPAKNIMRAQIYQSLLRSSLYANQLREKYEADGRLDLGEQQSENMQIIDGILERLKELDYPSKISNQQIREQFDKYFPISRPPKPLQK